MKRLSTIAGSNNNFKAIFSMLIALVWFINGLFCKVLNMVPRHQIIVSRILGEEYASVLTNTIGVLEIMMVVWIISGIKPRFCALMQMFIVASMVLIESIMVPELLLFGRANLVFAALFIGLIGVNEFYFSNKLLKQA